MRLLFSGDWHVGARTWGLDRMPEAVEGIRQVLAYAESFSPQIVVLLGDIFHSLRYPGDEAGALVASTVARLLALPGAPEVFFLRGNHDWNGVRVWEHLERSDRFRVIEQIEVVERGSLLLTLVPHLKRHLLRDESLESQIVRALAPYDAEGKILLCAAHLAMENTVPGLREPTISPRALGDLGFGSLVCGHIHRHGQVQDAPIPSFYAGSLFRGDFAEEASDLGVVLVDDATLSCKPLEGRALHTLAFTTVQDALTDLPTRLAALSENAYVRVALSEEAGGEAYLLERFRDLPGGERIVRVKGTRRWEASPENPSPVDTSLETLWESYVTSNEEREDLRPLLTRGGLDLLRGDEPEDVWQMLRREVLAP